MSRTPASRLAKPPLLTQVLAVNAAIICATVLASSVAWGLDARPSGVDRERFLA